MRRSPRAYFLMALVGLTLAGGSGGCATYSPVGEKFDDRRTKLTVSLPSDWLQFTPARDEYLMTRDGLRLEQIGISVKRTGEKLPKTERVYRAGMLPFEVAELSLGLIEAGGSAKNFKTDAIETASVAGHDGYRADASFLDNQGLPMRLRIYGALLPDAVCEFRYLAERSIYFEKYLPVFERVVSSATVGTD